MRAVPKVQPGQTLSINGSAKTQTVLLPLLLIENTSLVCCYLYGFNIKSRIIPIDTSAFESITQHKQVQLLPRHCTVIKILLFNKKKKEKHLSPVHLNNILAMSSKLYQNFWKKHTVSPLILAGRFSFLFIIQHSNMAAFDNDKYLTLSKFGKTLHISIS